MSTVKRVYFYTVTIITLGMLAAGVGILLNLILGLLVKGIGQIQIGEPSFAQEQVSLGLAMIVIGGTLWFLFWRIIQKQASGNTAETGSAIRKLFLNIILVVSAFTALYAAAEFLVWLMAGAQRDQFTSGQLSAAIVAGIIWYYHRRVSEKEGQPSPAARTLRRWYVYILSGWGLVSLSVGLIMVINNAIFNLPFWRGDIVQARFWDSSVQRNLSLILLGGLTWYFHWFRMAKGDYDSTLRQVYLYLLAIFGGAITGLVALTTFLFKIIRFPMGSLNVAANAYFQFLGWAIPTMLVAAAVWTYHQNLVREETAHRREQQFSARRVLFYLMSFIGLGTLIAGLIILIGIPLDLLINAGQLPPTVSAGWWQDQLALSLALLIVATPLWLYCWSKVLQMGASGEVEEFRARSRRIFLYIILGVSIITLAADLVNIVYQLLNGLLQGEFGVKVLRDSKWSLQTIFIAIPVLWYHWHVLRQDQRLGAEIMPLRKTVTLLAGESADELASQIEDKLGTRLRRLRYLGEAQTMPVLSDEDIEKLAADVQATQGEKIMLVAAEGKIIVLPYEDK